MFKKIKQADDMEIRFQEARSFDSRHSSKAFELNSSKLPTLADILNAKGMGKLKRNFLQRESSSEQSSIGHKEDSFETFGPDFMFTQYHSKGDRN
jgi:hypothetical protein